MENAKKDNQKIVVYRYMWLFDGNDNLNIKVLSGVKQEHDMFIEHLKNDERVTKACRVYLHEIDINLIEFYDDLKKEGEKNVEKK